MFFLNLNETYKGFAQRFQRKSSLFVLTKKSDPEVMLSNFLAIPGLFCSLLSSCKQVAWKAINTSFLYQQKLNKTCKSNSQSFQYHIIL